MPSICIKIEWNTALNEKSVKYEIMKALEKQYPEIKFSFYDLPEYTETYDEFIDELYNTAMEDDIPEWVMNGGSE